MDRRPPVTIVAHEVGTVGGMETQLRHLVTGLLSRGVEVTVIARRCELPAHPGLTYHHVAGPRRPFPLGYPLFFLLGSLAVRRHRRGVLHTTGAVVTNRAEVSTVHHLHRYLHRHSDVLPRSRDTVAYRVSAWISERLKDLGEAWAYRPAITRRLAVASGGLAAEIGECFPDMADRVRVIPMGVDLDRFRPDPESRDRIRAELGLGQAPAAVFVGGDWERKGLRQAIAALALAPAWRLLVVGGGDVAGHTELARAAGCADRVHFVVRPPETAPYYAAADAFLMPSHYETFSMVTYEAAATGLPLLATRQSGIADIVVDDMTGWLISQAPEEIAEKLRRLEDAELRRRLGEAARRRVAGYGWDAMVDGYVALYQEVA